MKLKKLLIACMALAFTLPLVLIVSGCSNDVPVGGEPEPTIVTFTLHDGIIDGGTMNGTTSTKSVEKGDMVTIRPLTFISFNYFADVLRNGIFAWRHQVDTTNGLTVYVYYDIEVQTINMQNTVGIGATQTPSTSAPWLNEVMEGGHPFNLSNSSTGVVDVINSIGNTNDVFLAMHYIRKNDLAQTPFHADNTRISASSIATPERTFNSPSYDINLTIHYPSDFVVFIFYIIYVPELGFHVAMPSTINAPLTSPPSHAQFTNANGQTFRLTFGIY